MLFPKDEIFLITALNISLTHVDFATCHAQTHVRSLRNFWTLSTPQCTKSDHFPVRLIMSIPDRSPQCLRKHPLFCLKGGHNFPPFSDGLTMTSRWRFRVPTPHRCEHDVHRDQVDTTQSRTPRIQTSIGKINMQINQSFSNETAHVRKSNAADHDKRRLTYKKSLMKHEKGNYLNWLAWWYKPGRDKLHQRFRRVFFKPDTVERILDALRWFPACLARANTDLQNKVKGP